MNEKKSILVVDDEVGYRDFYRYCLEPLGHRVETAVDGLQGLEKALNNKFDLIVLDVHMPKMTGPEMLEQIKRSRPDQKVILCSSGSDPEYRLEDQGKRSGAQACFFKPMDLDEIMRVVEAG